MQIPSRGEKQFKLIEVKRVDQTLPPLPPQKGGRGNFLQTDIKDE